MRFSFGNHDGGAYAGVEVSKPSTHLIYMKTYSRFLGLAALGLLSTLAVPNCRAEGPYKLLKESRLVATAARDYLSVEQEGRGSMSATPRRWW